MDISTYKDFVSAVKTMRDTQKMRAKALCSKERCERAEANVDSMIKQLTEPKETKTRSLF
jgi:hypothetical protein